VKKKIGAAQGGKTSQNEIRSRRRDAHSWRRNEIEFMGKTEGFQPGGASRGQKKRREGKKRPIHNEVIHSSNRGGVGGPETTRREKETKGANHLGRGQARGSTFFTPLASGAVVKRERLSARMVEGRQTRGRESTKQSTVEKVLGRPGGWGKHRRERARLHMKLPFKKKLQDTCHLKGENVRRRENSNRILEKWKQWKRTLQLQ